MMFSSYFNNNTAASGAVIYCTMAEDGHPRQGQSKGHIAGDMSCSQVSTECGSEGLTSAAEWPRHVPVGPGVLTRRMNGTGLFVTAYCDWSCQMTHGSSH